MPPTEDKVSSESGLCTDYSSSTNTHSRKTSSTWGDEEGIELEDMRASSTRTYTSRATLEVCTDPSGDDGNGACAVNTNSTDVDASVLFPLKSKCSPTPFTSSISSGGDTESHPASSNSISSSSYNYVRLSDLEYCTSSLLSSSSHSTTRNESSGNIISTLSIPPQPISLGGSEPLHAYSGSGYISSLDKCKSGYDENGNTVSQSDRKKNRRHKAKNEKNTYLAETVDGFRGTLKLHELLLFIENEPGSKKKNKMSSQQQQHAKKKTKDDSEQPKKRKGKDKLTKCNSLEEISKTKLEDLTSTPCQNQRLRPKKQVTLDDEELGWHRREDDNNSVSADEALVGRKRKDGRTRDKERGERERSTRTDDEESEFRLVQTKKHRRRKRRSSHNEQNQPDVFRTARSSPDRRSVNHRTHHRTSSMPPSDRSDCSDLDSVHSLPVTSQHGRRAGTATPSSQEYASASTSPNGNVEANHSLPGMGGKGRGASPCNVAGEVNHSPAGTGKTSRQRVTSSPGGGGNNTTAHTRSNSCTFGTIPSGVSVATETNGMKLTKAVSCHSSSMCVNESGISGRSLTKSTPNSTMNLAGNISTSSGGNPEKHRNVSTSQSGGNLGNSAPAVPNTDPCSVPTIAASTSGGNVAVNAAKSNSSTVSSGAKSASPERRKKSTAGAPPSHSQATNHLSSRVHCVDNQPPNQDCCSSESSSSQPVPVTIGWTEGDYPPLPANVAHQPTNNVSIKSESISHRSDSNHSHRSSVHRSEQALANGLSNEEHVRNGSTDRKNGRRNGPTNSDTVRNGADPILCNGDSDKPGTTGEEIVETVTLSLKNNSNKHRAPSPASGSSNSNNNNCCDVFVEFNLPPPPPPLSSTVPVDVTVEKTVIIRSQSCTGVSESVSLIIPPPPSTTRKSSRNHPAAGTPSTPLPPVILLDSRISRKKQDFSSASRPSDLTFGFEINPTLLNQGRSSAPTPTGKGELVCPAHKLRAQDDERVLAECFNYTDIVNFIGNAWKDVMKDLTNQKSSSSNRINYYSHQATASSSPS